MRYAVAIALAVLFATPVWAQQVEIKKPAPPAAREPERDVIPPGLYDETRPSDADHYPRGGQVQHDPAFFGPLSRPRETPTSSGRIGLAGWVSPSTRRSAMTSSPSPTTRTGSTIATGARCPSSLPGSSCSTA